MKYFFVVSFILFGYLHVLSQGEHYTTANDANTKTLVKDASVRILWSGPGSAKLIFNGNETAFAEGQLQTLELFSGKQYNLSVDQSGKKYPSKAELKFEKGKQGIIVTLVHDSLVVTHPDKLVDDLKGDMVLVAGGRYNLGCGNVWGSPCLDLEKRNDSGIAIIDTFYMCKFDVTQDLWEAITGSNPSYFKGCGRCPVENISWFDAQAFIKTLNTYSGRHYRLPTSAEWEFAARGGNKALGDYYAGLQGDIAWNELNEMLWSFVMGTKLSSFKNCSDCPIQDLSWDNAQAFVAKLNEMEGGESHYKLGSESDWRNTVDKLNKGHKYAGSNNLDEVAWYYANSNYSTHPVGLKKPNELGLYDMNGNVWQWCSDWFGMDTADYNYSPPPSNFGNNPKGRDTGKKRLIRGSAWWMNKDFFRITMQYGWEPDYRFSDVGLRLVSIKDK